MDATLLPPPSGTLERGLHRFPVRVYYEDTDAGGIVYHASYLRFFERARTELLRLLGIHQGAASDAGEGVYAVADLAIRYAVPARLDDTLTIETRALEIRAASVRAHQRALRGDTLVAEQTVRVGFIGPDGRPRRQPAAWRAALEQFNPEEPA
ncbi:MAG: tol-pal system-associated acyl-CoA thioesterase [Sphingomonadales bacterium 32-68-7]|nr:MAG: tol-pal system-associated acyl-CoA thioesterase [Sphingomonadales bacterium 12-68-11]OYX08694.1 MAG: tol-pal system-associated acyl-CoA thioesterase [Sphingomonadales bacterium 32-68-7]